VENAANSNVKLMTILARLTTTNRPTVPQSKPNVTGCQEVEREKSQRTVTVQLFFDGFVGSFAEIQPGPMI
jgi:hypothetical protein